MAIDISAMPRKELEKLRKQIDRALEKLDAESKKAALEAVRKAAATHGYSLGELVGGPAPKARKSPGTKGEAKFANPDNPKQTWTGKGRQPGWFKSAIAASNVSATPVADQAGDGKPDGYAVVYESPSQGRMEFDWHGPLVVDGFEIPLADYPRYDNPFAQTAFGDDRYEIEHDGYSLTIDFATGEREVSGRRLSRKGPSGE